MEQKIIDKDDLIIQKEYLLDLYDDFLLLWEFTSTNKISEMISEKDMEEWSVVVKKLKTYEIYRSFDR